MKGNEMQRKKKAISLVKVIEYQSRYRTKYCCRQAGKIAN